MYLSRLSVWLVISASSGVDLRVGCEFKPPIGLQTGHGGYFCFLLLICSFIIMWLECILHNAFFMWSVFTNTLGIFQKEVYYHSIIWYVSIRSTSLISAWTGSHWEWHVSVLLDCCFYYLVHGYSLLFYPVTVLSLLWMLFALKCLSRLMLWCLKSALSNFRIMTLYCFLFLVHLCLPLYF